MNRSILDNPKQNQKVTIDLNEKDGLITSSWYKRRLKLYRSLIPSHVAQDKQKWLNTTEEILAFLENLKDPSYDISKIEYVCITTTISDVYDTVDFLTNLKNKLPEHAKLIYSNYNWRWEYLFKLSSLIGLSRKSTWGNFFRDDDLDCFLNMAGWENVSRMNKFLIPVELKFIGAVFDGLVRLPILKAFSLNTIFIARIKNEKESEEHSVTVIVPCKNEEDNIEAIVKRMPLFGKEIEILFVNDKSTDATEERVVYFQKQNKKIKLIQGLGKGKGEALRTAMKEASGDICMILDADLSVIPEDLPQFYNAINNRRADFLHGSRMVYPQEDEAMRPANILGNFAFSMIFSYILEQRITDTLCGTKVFWRRDWPIFEEMRAILKHSDVWGDYNLIFGAARFGLKIGELPVRYFQRLKGVTKMTKRMINGLIMLRVAWHALWEVKFFG